MQLVSGYGAANWSVIAEVRIVRLCSALLSRHQPADRSSRTEGDVTGGPDTQGRCAIDRRLSILCAFVQSLGGNPPRNGKSCRLR